MTAASPLNQKKLSAKWREKGFSCGLWVDPPGQRWENYAHDVDEMLAVQNGVLEVEMKGHIYRLEEGEEIFIPAGIVHCVRNIGGTTARWFYGYRSFSDEP